MTLPFPLTVTSHVCKCPHFHDIGCRSSTSLDSFLTPRVFCNQKTCKACAQPHPHPQPRLNRNRKHDRKHDRDRGRNRSRTSIRNRHRKRNPNPHPKPDPNSDLNSHLDPNIIDSRHVSHPPRRHPAQTSRPRPALGNQRHKTLRRVGWVAHR